MKYTFLLLSTAVLTATSLQATVEQSIIDGRAQLEAQSIVLAETHFEQAVSKSPTHQEANALYGITRVIALLEDSDFTTLLSDMGATVTSSNVYHYQVDFPADAEGLPLFDPDYDDSTLIDFITTEARAEILSAISNLDQVTDSSFVLNLTMAETGISDVSFDYGDILMLRAGLHFLASLSYFADDYDLSGKPYLINAMNNQDAFTLQMLITLYPNYLANTSTVHLGSAESHFREFCTLYGQASDLIRARLGSTSYFFNLDSYTQPDEADFRNLLENALASLDTPTEVTPGYVVDGSAVFDGSIDIPAQRPAVSHSEFIAGTLPDPTFGGLLPNVTETEFEGFLADLGLLSPGVVYPEIESYDPEGWGDFGWLDATAFTHNGEIKILSNYGRLFSTDGESPASVIDLPYLSINNNYDSAAVSPTGDIVIAGVFSIIDDEGYASDYQPVVLHSTDAINWVDVTPESLTNPGAVSYVNGQFILSGNDFYTSATGTSWLAMGSSTQAYGETYYYNGVYYCNDYRSVYSSTDLQNWISRFSAGTNRNIDDVGYHEGTSIIIMQNSSQWWERTVLTSNDFSNWNESLTVSGWTSIFPRVLHDNGEFLLIGLNQQQDDEVYTSPDGLNWEVSQEMPAGKGYLLRKTSQNFTVYLRHKWGAEPIIRRNDGSLPKAFPRETELTAFTNYNNTVFIHPTYLPAGDEPTNNLTTPDPLPAGLSMAANGLITGNTAFAGTSTVDIDITNGSGTSTTSVAINVVGGYTVQFIDINDNSDISSYFTKVPDQTYYKPGDVVNLRSDNIPAGYYLSYWAESDGETRGWGYMDIDITITKDTSFYFDLATVTVPQVWSHPYDSTTYVNDQAWLSTEIGGGNISIQWYEGTAGDTSTPYTGVVEFMSYGSSTYSSISPSFATPGTYTFWARGSNSQGSVDTQTVTVTVNETVVPSITWASQLEQTFYPDGFVEVYVYAVGGDLTYTWFAGESGDTSLPATDYVSSGSTYSYIYPDANTVGTYTYWCRISNDKGSVDSDTFTVIIKDTEPPTITSDNGDQSVDKNNWVYFNAHAAGGITSAVWYNGESGDTSKPVSDYTYHYSDYTEVQPDTSTPGTYHFWVRISNDKGVTDSRTFTLTVTTPDWISWLINNSLPSDATGDGAYMAEPANDGVPNIVKYAFGMKPHVSSNRTRSDEQPNGLPILTNEADDIVMIYTRDKAAVGIVYQPVFRTDLNSPWQTSYSGMTHQKIADDGYYETWEVRIPTSEVADSLFMSVSITLN